MIAVVVGVAVFFVLAQFMDGRWAWFVGLGTTVAIGNWKRGHRAIPDFIGVAIAALLGLGTFFLLLGLNGWLGIIVGSAVTMLVATIVDSKLEVWRIVSAANARQSGQGG